MSAAVSGSSNGSCAITWHQSQAPYPIETSSGRSSHRARSRAPDPTDTRRPVCACAGEGRRAPRRPGDFWAASWSNPPRFLRVVDRTLASGVGCPAADSGSTPGRSASVPLRFAHRRGGRPRVAGPRRLPSVRTPLLVGGWGSLESKEERTRRRRASRAHRPGPLRRRRHSGEREDAWGSSRARSVS
jgi:hypothetical protein